MERIVKGAMVTLIIGSIIALIGSLNYTLGKYCLSHCEVIDTNNNIISIEDTKGNIWKYEDVNHNYKVGDELFITMHDNGTDTITDDKIIDIQIY